MIFTDKDGICHPLKSPLPRTRGLLPLVLCLVCSQLSARAHSRRGTPAQSRSTLNITRHLEILGFTLGKSTFADVEAKLGKSPAGRCSPGEEASIEVCYFARDGRTRVVFESGSSGGWKVLDGYEVIASNLHWPCYGQCPRASRVTSDVQTEGGLKLGLTREKLIALLGPPKKTRGNEFTFEWDSRVAMTEKEEETESKTFNEPIRDAYWDVDDTIRVTLADSKVVEFTVEHVVSY